MIPLSDFFRMREKPTEAIIQLLESVTLGTDGAHYKHLDTRQRIMELDNPLFLSLERNEKVYGNVTFCRRGSSWYIRYFAFDSAVQSAGKKKSKSKARGLKKELNDFFDTALTMEGGAKISSFYAYIDPRNAKSVWMSDNFGFKKVGSLATQTFSRKSPRSSVHVERIEDWNQISKFIEDSFSGLHYYFADQTKKAPFYVVRDENQEIIACAKISVANWKFERLPGRFGGVLVKLIPFIPILRKLIQPKMHSFIVPEAVFIKENKPSVLEELFEGMLEMEKKNLLIWWVDFNDELYASIRNRVKWGVLNKLLGVNEVDIVSKSLETSPSKEKKVFYTSGFDFI